MGTLEEIRHSMYVRSERWWWAACGLVLIGTLAGLFSIRPGASAPGAFGYVVVVLSALAPLAAAFARARSATFAGRADLCRRAFLYKDTLGITLPIEDLRNVALWPSNTPLNSATKSAPYYSTNQAQGPGRLANAVAESAFFTAELARIMAVAGVTLVAAVVVAIITVVSVLPSLALTTALQATLSTTIGAIASLTLSWILGEILVTTLAYQALARECRAVSQSAAQFHALADQGELTAMRISETYSIALAANLPIPNFLYRCHRDRLDRAYRAATGT